MVPAHSIETSHKCNFSSCAKRQPAKRRAICLWLNVGQFKGHRAKHPKPNWFVARYASPVLPSSMMD